MSKKPADPEARKAWLAEFAARNRDNPAAKAVLKQLTDLYALSMPRNLKRLTPVLERMHELARIDPAAVGDATYRQIEEMHFGKPGQVPKVYFRTAARDFVARTSGDNPLSPKAARKAVIADVMAEYSITEDYAKRRLGEEIKALEASRAKTAK